MSSGTTVHVRPPAVAGLFYPADPRVLRRDVEHFLAAAPPATPAAAPPKLLVVPHAGYQYSGAVAASAYATLAAARDRIRRVVLIGPAHRVFFHGLALPVAQAFDTPLGLVRVDVAAAEQLRGTEGVVFSDAAHEAEHSLEVQLPFLQALLPDFRLLPIVAGAAPAGLVARVLERVWGGDDTLIVVSTDLSHYHDSRDARVLDAATAAHILALEPVLDGDAACGCVGLNAALAVARRRKLVARRLDLRNSADTAGDSARDSTRVVGYGAFAFHEPGHADA